MKNNRLGLTDLYASPLGFGCSHIASLTTKYSRREVSSTLQSAFDAGINFFDTADIYGQGDSERLLGKLFAQQRQRVLFCSKAGLTLGAPQRMIRYLKPLLNPIIRQRPTAAKKTTALRHRAERQCFETDYIQRQIHNSLQRLGTDYLDLFLLHNPPAEVIANDALFEKLQSLQAEGLLRYYGVSCRHHDDAYLCLERPGIACVQLNLDPVNIRSAMPLLEQLRHKEIGVIARECLTNKEEPYSAWYASPTEADKKRFSPSQLALQAVVNNQAIDVALVGMSCQRHLTENLAVVP